MIMLTIMKGVFLAVTYHIILQCVLLSFMNNLYYGIV